jgi:hypothetical protein
MESQKLKEKLIRIPIMRIVKIRNCWEQEEETIFKIMSMKVKMKN